MNNESVLDASVSYFNKEKKYGFAVTEAGQKVFLHVSQQFEVKSDEKGRPYFSGKRTVHEPETGQSIKILLSHTPPRNGQNVPASAWTLAELWVVKGPETQPNGKSTPTNGQPSTSIDRHPKNNGDNAASNPASAENRNMSPQKTEPNPDEAALQRAMRMSPEELALAAGGRNALPHGRPRSRQPHHGNRQW